MADKLLKTLLTFAMVISFVIIFGAAEVSAADLEYTSSVTGYTLIVDDEQDLFSDTEIKQLVEAAGDVLDYGNVAVVTTAAPKYVSADYFDYEGNAKAALESYFGYGSDSTIFQICMNPRKLTIWSEGAIYDKVDTGKALSITDNVYRQASGGYYFDCAKKVLRQEATLLSGGVIIEPMKYIGNFFLAFMVAILVTFALTFILLPQTSKEVVAGLSEAALSAIAAGIIFSFAREERIYDPVRDSSSGTSGGGGGGGGSSGGGGGSHGF